MLGLDLFLDAFFDLENDRPWMVGHAAIPLPIPWRIIHEYALFHELTGDLYDDLLYFIGELDAAYIKHIHRKTG